MNKEAGPSLFSPGRIVMTHGAVDALNSANVPPEILLARHLSGDWGAVCDADRDENELSLREGFRLHSVYPLPDSDAIVWIITEWDRSVTTFLLPSEY